MLLDIINSNNKDTKIKTINQLKDILVEEYTKLDDPNLNKMFHLYGKKQLAKKLLNKTLTLETAIMSDDYYIINYDIGLIAKHLGIPIVLISSRKLKENHKSVYILNPSTDDQYYFIKVLSFKNNIPHMYHVFTTSLTPLTTFKYTDAFSNM